MPGLDKKIIADLTERVGAFVENLPGYKNLQYIASGGSAAVFRSDSPNGPRIFKAFNPELLSGKLQNAERRRLQLQKQLIGHSCPYLVQTFSVEESHGTGIVEMEYIDYPSLYDVLAEVPDEAIPHLIMQLVEAVKFLDKKKIVHRDIKPENIHISKDYSLLKLLDLGVSREYHLDAGGDETDQGQLRPFLATAQYSSPEYLFRLDPPSAKLWLGLNLYQIGAVLHDLIMKKPIFYDELITGNRFVVARAVLLTTPSFKESDPSRLLSLKMLAAKCLVKDLDLRLNLISWNDFLLQKPKDSLGALKHKIAGRRTAANHNGNGAVSQLEFNRSQLIVRITDYIRKHLIPILVPQIPTKAIIGKSQDYYQIQITASVNNSFDIQLLIKISWLSGIYQDTANIELAAFIHKSNEPEISLQDDFFKTICAVKLNCNEDISAQILIEAAGNTILSTIDLIESSLNSETLHNLILTI